MKLEPKQEQFCKEYIIDLNATKAAIRAGYSKKTAKGQGARLLTKEHVQRHIELLMQKRSQRTEITADKVIEELAKIGFHNLQDYISKGNSVRDFAAIPREHAASIESVKVIERTTGTGKAKVKEVTTSFKLHNKESALEMLGRHLGIFEKDNNQKGKVKIAVSVKKKDGN